MIYSKLRKFLISLIVLTTGILIARTFHENAIHQLEEKYQSNFILNSSNNHLLLTSEMQENLKLLQSFVAFFSASSVVDENEFEVFAGNILESANALGFCWYDQGGDQLGKVSRESSFDICQTFSILEPNKAFTSPSPYITLSTFVSSKSGQKGHISVIIGFSALSSKVTKFKGVENSLILADMSQNNFLKYNVKTNSMKALTQEKSSKILENRVYDIATFSDMKFIYHASLIKKDYLIENSSLITLVLICIVTFLLTVFVFLIIGQNDEINRQVALKTSELREQVEYSQKLADAKSEFLANMSHEIRTPLNGVMGMLELIEVEKLEEENKKFLLNARSASQMLLRILNDILDLSKIDALQLKMELIEFNLIEALKETVTIVHPEILKKNIKFNQNYKNVEGVNFVGDPIRIKQILLNLLSNAAKFTSEGSIDLKITENIIDNYSSQIVIDVADSGVGISNEASKKLFKKFSQADNSITRKFGGSGLGLIISKNLSNLMGGDIIFQSQLGVGSTFTANFIIKRVTEDNALNKNIPRKSAPELQKALDGKIVLVAEDNQLNQKVLLSFLKKLKCRVLIANDGLEAVEKVKGSDHIDLVLMDVQMPKLDGLGATREIIELLGQDAPPIIAITANSFEEDKKRCREAGMKDFLSKPISLDKIKKTLEKFC